MNDIIIRVHAGDAQTRFLAHRHGCNVTHQHGIAAALRDHGGGKIVDGTDKADAANHRRLRTDVDGVAADIDVGVTDGLQHQRQRQAERRQLVEIHLKLVGLGLAAPARDIDDAGHAAKAALQHPVLQGLQIKNTVVRRSDQPIAEDFADRAQRRNLRLHIARQGTELRQAVEHLLQGFVVGVVERKLQFDVRESVKRNRAKRPQILQARDLGLDRDGDVTLDFLGRQAGTLRYDVDHRRRGIRIGLDVQLLEGDDAANHRHDEQHHHEVATVNSKSDKAIHRDRSFSGSV